ncbi:MAG: hypothetical protein PHE32_02095 [Candidatus Shapirobacteria bacterium]|nr:hypothetical protein [Candidatus Shapirobacteria bacterium]MDD4410461.1 hypothetical protein [Candidatus Shapirobacteria bacterium]
MKLFKIFLFIIFIFSLSLSVYSLVNFSENKIDPTSTKNNFYLQIEHGLKTAQINITKSTTRDYQNQFEFYIINESNNPIKIILSTKKNPYWQITSLQEILKTAKINNKQLQLVDLSISHPYATYKNN